jgi:hypothetical protein
VPWSIEGVTLLITEAKAYKVDGERLIPLTAPMSTAKISLNRSQKALLYASPH